MISGRFYFRQTQNGNLIGEYSNQNSTRNVSESANQTVDSDFPFVGTYNSTWFEDNPRAAESMTLVISLIPGTRDIYRLIWSNGKQDAFFGEAFIAEDLLIGNYWDDQVTEALRTPRT